MSYRKFLKGGGHILLQCLVFSSPFSMRVDSRLLLKRVQLIYNGIKVCIKGDRVQAYSHFFIFLLITS